MTIWQSFPFVDFDYLNFISKLEILVAQVKQVGTRHTAHCAASVVKMRTNFIRNPSKDLITIYCLLFTILPVHQIRIDHRADACVNTHNFYYFVFKQQNDERNMLKKWTIRLKDEQHVVFYKTTNFRWPILFNMDYDIDAMIWADNENTFLSDNRYKLYAHVFFIRKTRIGFCTENYVTIARTQRAPNKMPQALYVTHIRQWR